MYSLPLVMETFAPGILAIRVAALAHMPSIRMFTSSNPAPLRMLRMATASVTMPPGELIRIFSFLTPLSFSSLMALSKSLALLSSG